MLIGWTYMLLGWTSLLLGLTYAMLGWYVLLGLTVVWWQRYVKITARTVQQFQCILFIKGTVNKKLYFDGYNSVCLHVSLCPSILDFHRICHSTHLCTCHLLHQQWHNTRRDMTSCNIKVNIIIIKQFLCHISCKFLHYHVLNLKSNNVSKICFYNNKLIPWFRLEATSNTIFKVYKGNYCNKEQCKSNQILSLIQTVSIGL